MLSFSSFTPRQIFFSATSVALGIWAFVQVNAISGPVFEPIVAACTNTDLTSDMDKFVSETGYHAFEPAVGFKVFNVLVCLITQFLFELRQTHPAGLLTWSGVILVGLSASVPLTVEAGRKGVRGIINYPIVVGLLFQLLGISVIFPLLWVPGYILGRGNGPVTKYRAMMTLPLNLPGAILTTLVFTADPTSYLWTVSAGMLGGPMLALSPMTMWMDQAPTNSDTKQESISTIRKVSYILTAIGTLGWYTALYIIHENYGTDAKALWDDIWVNANGSVAFMTIDTGVLYLGLVWMIAYLDVGKAAKTLALLPLLGPSAASLVLGELEETRYNTIETKEKKAA